MVTLKVLAALLDYPDERMLADLPEMQSLMEAEKVLPPEALVQLARFMSELEDADLLDSQAEWVSQFDQSRSLSLNLFEHVHGDSRDRGQAMVDLRAMYTANGLEPAADELPDYLPLFLEYLAMRPSDEALNLLAEASHVVAALAERLRARSSRHAPVMEAVSLLAGVRVGEVATPDTDPDMDEAWAEEPVEFGPGSALGACDGGAALRARLEGTMR
jgi:nitrate reductase delta subunit